MSHSTKKKIKRKTPKHYTPIEKTHCKVKKVVEAIYACIATNWITKDEWEQIVTEINTKIKKNK